MAKKRKRYADYNDYIASVDWLILKTKLVNRYLRQKWPIDCFVCGSVSSLQVHHFSYAGLYTDEEIDNLGFICRDCHSRWHKEKGFKDGWMKEAWEVIFGNSTKQ